MNAVQLAKLFHETYEALAPCYGYETRKDTRVFSENSKNGKLMIAVCLNILVVLEEADRSIKTQEVRLLRKVHQAAFNPLSQANDSLEWYRKLQVPLNKYEAWLRKQEKARKVPKIKRLRKPRKKTNS